MKRIPGMPGTSPEPPRIAGIPWARPWDPRGRAWDLKARLWDAPGTSMRAPGHAPGTPQGRPYDHQGLLWTTKKVISTNVQRQKLSIAVFEPACWSPSPEGLPRAVLFITNSPNHTKNLWPWDFGEVFMARPETPPPSYILDI